MRAKHSSSFVHKLSNHVRTDFSIILTSSQQLLKTVTVCSIPWCW